MKYLNHILFFTLFITACGTSSPTDFELEKDKILTLEKKQQQYHLEKNAEEFVRLFSDEFINVNNGNISTPKKIESYERFYKYFKSVEFLKWDDIKDPIIRISEDGKMAYSVINKEVIISYFDEEQIKQVTDTTYFAWTTIYNKENGDWKIDCVTSTNQ